MLTLVEGRDVDYIGSFFDAMLLTLWAGGVNVVGLQAMSTGWVSLTGLM